MKNKQIALFLTMLLLAAGLFAQNRVVDNAGLLNDADRQDLEQRISAIAGKYNFDLVIVTENGIGNVEVWDYADDFFDYNGYGLGGDRDGCLLLVVIASRDMFFSTSGRGIKVLGSAAYKKLEDDVYKQLKNGAYRSAFITYMEDWETFLELDANGRRFNIFHQWNIIMVAAGWLVALAIGFGIVAAWKSKMNTALRRGEAAAYIIPGSLGLTDQRDSFLYSTVTKTRRESNSSSSGGGGMRTSSSGRSHGGGGRKF